MVSALETPFGHAAPPYPGHSAEHAITTNFPKWSHLLGFIDGDPKIMTGFTNMYPRVIQQKDVRALCQAVVKRFDMQGKTCLIFPAQDAAKSCIEYATSTSRGDKQIPGEMLTIKSFSIDQQFWAVFFPLEHTPNIVMFWINPGLGISTRQAEAAMEHIDRFSEVDSEVCKPVIAAETTAYEKLRARVVHLLSRSPLEPSLPLPAPSDVYLFQTGMAGIFRIHEYLSSEFQQISVVYGFPFHSTYHIFEDFGHGFEFFGLGDVTDLKKLEDWLEMGNKIQALYCEFPSNPIAVTPDVTRLRQLADRYRFFLIIDDTVGSFCNVDLLSVADAILTSLTKSFSGYADVMGGSIVLNPRMARYEELNGIVRKHYRNDLYSADAAHLLSNSEDYLARSAVLNRNSLALATYVDKLAKEPSSPIKKVYYPPFHPSRDLYKAYMRPTTDEFAPGYGCLLSIEFIDLPSTIAFYDALDVFKAPHLGAHTTLCLPYVKGLFSKQLDWAAQYDLRETMLRVAPGLEDEGALLRVFEAAFEVARKSLHEGNAVAQAEIATIS